MPLVLTGLYQLSATFVSDFDRIPLRCLRSPETKAIKTSVMPTYSQKRPAPDALLSVSPRVLIRVAKFQEFSKLETFHGN